ncbi:MAG: IclR family transcriptional regulator [Thermomicrobiales bacterium]
MVSAPGRIQSEGQFTRTVLKALDVLECLAGAGQPLTAQEVAHECGLSRTTAHRLLTTLLTRGYVASPSEGHYRLGAGLLRLSHSLLAELELPALAKPELHEISRRCNETAYLAVLEGGEILYLDRVASSQSVRLRSNVGTRGQLHCTSLGKAMLAFLPPEERAAQLAALALTPRTPHTITDRAVLAAHLDEVRRQGYALDDIENEDGVRCLSAPIFGHDGQVRAAVSVAGPAFRLPVERLLGFAPVVIGAAAAVSARLGYLPGGVEPGARSIACPSGDGEWVGESEGGPSQ